MREINPIKLERLQKSIDVLHPWTVNYRVPAVHSLYPSWSFIASLAVESDEDNALGHFLAPADEDAKLVGSYIDYCRSFLYRDFYLKELDLYPVDLDGSVNTISFGLMAHGWVYRKSSWDNQPMFPYANSHLKFPTLLSLLDNIETRGTSENPKLNERWVAWKLAHNIVG